MGRNALMAVASLRTDATMFGLNLGCCVPSVIITRRYDPRAGCCAFTNVMIGVDSVDQAQELISFLEDKINPDVEKGTRKPGTFEGSQPALGLSHVSHAT